VHSFVGVCVLLQSSRVPISPLARLRVFTRRMSKLIQRKAWDNALVYFLFVVSILDLLWLNLE